MVFIASVQLMPTVLAASAFGIANIVANLLSILSSLIAEIEYPVPLLVNIGCAMFASISACYIIEKLPKFI